MWKWQKPSPCERTCHSVFPVLVFDNTRFICSTVIIGVGRHWQGGTMAPPDPKILSFWPLKRPKSGVKPPSENWKWLRSPQEPSFGKIPAYALDWRHRYHIHQARTKSVGRNFSREGLQASPGEGFQPFFAFQDSIFGRFNGQNERISRARGAWPSPAKWLPTPMARTGIVVLGLFLRRALPWRFNASTPQPFW